MTPRGEDAAARAESRYCIYLMLILGLVNKFIQRRLKSIKDVLAYSAFRECFQVVKCLAIWKRTDEQMVKHKFLNRPEL